MPPIFYFMLYTVLTCVHVQELYYNVAEGTVLFKHSLHFCQDFFCLHKKACIFNLLELFTLLSSHGARCSAVPSHRHNCIITSCVSKDKTGDNFMMWGEDCKMYVDTQYPSKILNGFCGVNTYVSWKTLQKFFLSGQLDEGEHSKFLVFQYGSWSSLLSPPGQNFTRTTPVSIWKTK